MAPRAMPRGSRQRLDRRVAGHGARNRRRVAAGGGLRRLPRGVGGGRAVGGPRVSNRGVIAALAGVLLVAGGNPKAPVGAPPAGAPAAPPASVPAGPAERGGAPVRG